MPIAAGAMLLGALAVRRAGSARRVPSGGSPAMQPDISSLNGTALPRLHVSALTGGRTGRLPDSGLVIFVQPRCVASRRLTAMIDGQLDVAKSEVPVILAVVAEQDEARRLAVAAPGQAQRVHVLPSRLPSELRTSIPCAVMLAPGRRVRHAGSMSDDSAMTRFIEACGDKRVRQWFNSLPAQTGT
ncbi:MAG TPA: hypothetical protein VGI74_22340 [Streptosporangiaceae bacterium]